MRDSLDYEIFEEAGKQNAVIMSKDKDFAELIEQHGIPPQIIWLTCGNTSNAKLQQILSKTLEQAKILLEQEEAIVEISGE